MGALDLAPLARERCLGMIDAVRGQTADILQIMKPLLPGPAPETGTTANEEPRGFPWPLTHTHNLFRDWGWPSDPDGENEKAVAMVEAVLQDQPLGQAIVIGAGGCRLAYDLHRHDPESEILVVDIDPLLFAVAHDVIRGGSIRLREANAEIDEIERIDRPWTLKAPHGPLDADRFHFVLADGLEPPLTPATFDTVITPWFIDLIPPDLRDFISTVHRLLKPSGRWLSLGPLRYAPERPVSRRFSREEVLDLAQRAGFHVDAWRTDSVPYLVSKLSARGRVEWVLAFSATKLADPSSPSTNDRPPAWLLFRHLRIPTFATQATAGKDPLAKIVFSAIDGRRTLDDLTSIVLSRIGQSASPQEIRDGLRHLLAETHPACSRDPAS